MPNSARTAQPRRPGRTLAGVSIAAALVAWLAAGRAPHGHAGAPAGATGERSTAVAGADLRRGSSPPAGTSEGRAATATGVPFDLRKIIDQVHFSYREDGYGWSGGHSTYTVRVVGGSLEVVPYDHPGGRAGVERAAPARARGREREREWLEPRPVEGSPVRFGASIVARGDALLAAGAGEVSRTEDGQLRVERPGVVERLENRADGVEQSWRFAAAPEGGGDLVVRMPVEGAFIGATEHGLHFTGGVLGVRYGHGTWIDALGVETEVPARWEDGAIALRVPAAVVEGSVYPAVLDPIVSPEIGLGDPVSGFAPGDQWNPAVASDGSGYLVAWYDRRAHTNGGGGGVYAARVSAAGVLLDRAGIVVRRGGADYRQPSLAWDGTNFLVAWREWVPSLSAYAIFGARVSQVGWVLDPAPLPIASGSGTDTSLPAVAWNGASHLVVWSDSRNGSGDVFGVRVSGGGTVLDSSPIVICGAAGGQGGPEIVWNGANHLVVWSDGRSGTRSEIYGARVSAAGAVLDASAFAISTGSDTSNLDVVWNGTTHLVVWKDERNAREDIYAARVSAAGSVLDPSGIPVCLSTSGLKYARWPQVASDGSGFLVAWEDYRNGTTYADSADIYAARVTDAGSVLDAAGILVSGAATSQTTPVLASNGAGYLVLWVDRRNGWGQDVYGARVTGAGAVVDASGFLVTGAGGQPAVASDGSSHLVVWADLPRPGVYSTIRGARVSASGALLDPAGIAIGELGVDQSEPALAWGGTSYLVVFQARGAIYGRRVGANGNVIGSSFTIANDIGGGTEKASPAVAWGSASHLVVWHDRASRSSYDIVGKRVSASGAVLDDPGITIGAAANDQVTPAVASNGSSFLVVWEDARSGTSADVYGARVSAAGTVLDGAGIPISTGANAEGAPAVSSDGSGYLVVWQDRRTGTSHDVYGARVNGAGAVLDASGIPIGTAAQDQLAPAVAWGGSNHVVAWQDGRSGTSYDVYTVRVGTDGAVLDGTGLAVAASARDESLPALASAGSDRVLIAYEDAGAQSVVARRAAFNPPPVAAAQSVSTPEDVALAVTLFASDATSYAIVSGPAHGTLTGSPPSVTYTPAGDYHGPDSFTFWANDGFRDSNVATVSITVVAVNDGPTALAQSLSTLEDAPLAVTLAGTDVDADGLGYSVVTAPAHGTLAGTAPGLTYTPYPNYSGSDSFTFWVFDGTSTSTAATVEIMVTPLNDAPVALPGSVSALKDRSVAVPISASDAEGDPLEYTIVSGPAHGVLSGTAPNLTYTPASGYLGADSFAFSASDGSLTSGAATIAIEVTQPSNPYGCATAAGPAPTGWLPLVALATALGLRSRRRPGAPSKG